MAEPAADVQRQIRRGMSPLKAATVFIVALLVFIYFVALKEDPFAHPYVLKAVFYSANDMGVRSPVRIAGIEVGKVTAVKPLAGTRAASEVTMELSKKALPIHSDAQLKIRTRIFLEGTYLVDLDPGTPSAPILHSGATIPPTQTTNSVQLHQVLTALQSDTRSDLQTFLKEYSSALSHGGATGYNRSIRYWAQAYRTIAIANQATLGTQPHDLSGLVRGQRDTFGPLSADVPALQGLVTNFNTTALAFARRNVALEQAVPALDAVLRNGVPALRALDAAFPPLRAFAREALPGTRSSVPALDASIPFITQARALFSKAELRGLVADLRPTIPALARLNAETVPFLEQTRQLSACQNKVIVPFSKEGIPDPDFPANSNRPFYKQAPQTLVGLAGESRESDALSPMFRIMLTVGPTTVVESSEGGQTLFGQTAFPPEGTRPAKPQARSRYRPDVPCETQDPPDMNAPRGDADATVVPNPLPIGSLPASAQARERRSARALQSMTELMQRTYRTAAKERAR